LQKKNGVRKNVKSRARTGAVQRRGAEGITAVAHDVVGLDGEVKRGAFADLAFHGNGAAHAFAETFGDNQAEAGAAAAAFGRRVYLAERTEKLVDLVGGNADAGVADGEVDAHIAVDAVGVRCAGAAFDGDIDVAALGELDGVADEVIENLAETAVVAVDDHGHAGGDAGLDGQAGIPRTGSEEMDDFLDAVAKGEGGVFDFDFARLDFGEIEDVADEVFQRLAAAGDHVDKGVAPG